MQKHMHSSIQMTPPASHILAHTLAHPHNACQRGCEVHMTDM